MIRNQEVVAGLTREIELRNMSDTRSKNKRNADFLSTFENFETKEGHCSQQFRPSVQKFAHEDELNKMADVRFGIVGYLSPSKVPTLERFVAYSNLHLPPNDSCMAMRLTLLKTNWLGTSDEQALCQFLRVPTPEMVGAQSNLDLKSTANRSMSTTTVPLTETLTWITLTASFTILLSRAKP